MAPFSKMTSAAASSSDLYEQDYFTWTQQQARALRDRHIEEVDWLNLADEVEDLGKSERRSLQNRIARLLEHLLKLAYARSRMLDSNARGWQLSAINARAAIAELLDDSPGLRPLLDDLFTRAYRIARNDTLKVLRLPDSAIPEVSSWTFDQIIDDSFDPQLKK